MNSRSEEAAIGCLAWWIRRKWAMTALRENARLKLDRLTQVGRGADSATQRRYRNDTECAQRRQLLHAQRMFDLRLRR